VGGLLLVADSVHGMAAGSERRSRRARPNRLHRHRRGEHVEGTGQVSVSCLARILHTATTMDDDNSAGAHRAVRDPARHVAGQVVNAANIVLGTMNESTSCVGSSSEIGAPPGDAHTLSAYPVDYVRQLQKIGEDRDRGGLPGRRGARAGVPKSIVFFPLHEPYPHRRIARAAVAQFRRRTVVDGSVCPRKCAG